MKNALNPFLDVYSRAIPIDHIAENTIKFEIISSIYLGILASSYPYGLK